MINRGYICDDCGYSFEVQQNMNEPLKKKCPRCGKMKLYQDLIGQHSFVYQEPSTLGHLGDRNRDRVGKYELEKIEHSRQRNKKKKPATWYNPDNKDLPNELRHLDTPEKKQKYILKGEQ